MQQTCACLSVSKKVNITDTTNTTVVTKSCI